MMTANITQAATEVITQEALDKLLLTHASFSNTFDDRLSRSSTVVERMMNMRTQGRRPSALSSSSHLPHHRTSSQQEPLAASSASKRQPAAAAAACVTSQHVPGGEAPSRVRRPNAFAAMVQHEMEARLHEANLDEHADNIAHLPVASPRQEEQVPLSVALSRTQDRYSNLLPETPVSTSKQRPVASSTTKRDKHAHSSSQQRKSRARTSETSSVEGRTEVPHRRGWNARMEREERNEYVVELTRRGIRTTGEEDLEELEHMLQRTMAADSLRQSVGIMKVIITVATIVIETGVTKIAPKLRLDGWSTALQQELLGGQYDLQLEQVYRKLFRKGPPNVFLSLGLLIVGSAVLHCAGARGTKSEGPVSLWQKALTQLPTMMQMMAGTPTPPPPAPAAPAPCSSRLKPGTTTTATTVTEGKPIAPPTRRRAV